MKQGKYAAPVRRRRRRNTLKPMLIAMAVVLLLGCVTGGTLAWLTSKPEAVVNTFTTSDVTITLDEEKGGDDKEFKMIPGWTIDKDPKVTVLANSEDCYVFVVVEEGNKLRDFISYGIVPGWNQLENDGAVVPGVYYRVVNTNTAKQTFSVIGYEAGTPEAPNFIPDKVLVKDSVTKEMMNGLTTIVEGNPVTTYPTLTFKAAAIQYYKTNGTEFKPYEAYQAIKWDDAATTT